MFGSTEDEEETKFLLNSLKTNLYLYLAKIIRIVFVISLND